MFYCTILQFIYLFCLTQNLENYTVLVAEATDNWDMETVRYAIILLFFAFNLLILPLSSIYQCGLGKVMHNWQTAI